MNVSEGVKLDRTENSYRLVLEKWGCGASRRQGRPCHTVKVSITTFIIRPGVKRQSIATKSNKLWLNLCSFTLPEDKLVLVGGKTSLSIAELMRGLISLVMVPKSGSS